MLPSLGGETDTPRHSLFRTAHRLAAQRNDGNRTQCEASTQDARRLGGLQGKRGTSVELPRVDSIAAPAELHTRGGLLLCGSESEEVPL